MRQLFLLTLITIFSFSCKKDNPKAGKIIGIYLLKTYQLIAGKCQISPGASSLQDTAVIGNNDIFSYARNDYKFTLTNIAMQKIKGFTDFTPFAMTVDKQVIYYGFFKPASSNSSCDNSITMDVDWATGNEVFLRLGYPISTQSATIDDQRNNEKLIATLKNQGKLK